MSKQSSPPRKFSSIGGTGCLVVVVLMFLILIAAGVFAGWRFLPAGDPTVVELPGIEDNTSPEQVLARREAAAAHLDSYGWVDESAGVARIPIEQAMAILIEEGLPSGPEPTKTPTPEPPTATPTPTLTPSPTPADDSQPPAVETSATETPTPEPTPTIAPTAVDLANVSFQSNVLPILEQHCVQCHGGPEPDGSGQRIEDGLNLLTYDDILAGSWNGSVVEPGDVADSYLVDQIVSGRMPKEGERLSSDEIEIISAWIETGALDN